eukprot:TRINITY_DN11375_c0_g1_i1.p1 TRINITY_DN11375_c0_g1~~TRINITY_DN11375_c0_g1_i1.p1  ORF type:complete len:409 (+),score=114.93 TRINITY_DN11375_c0_g1_i1:41-1228(+)
MKKLFTILVKKKQKNSSLDSLEENQEAAPDFSPGEIEEIQQDISTWNPESRRLMANTLRSSNMLMIAQQISLEFNPRHNEKSPRRLRGPDTPEKLEKPKMAGQSPRVASNATHHHSGDKSASSVAKLETSFYQDPAAGGGILSQHGRDSADLGAKMLPSQAAVDDLSTVGSNPGSQIKPNPTRTSGVSFSSSGSDLSQSLRSSRGTPSQSRRDISERDLFQTITRKKSTDSFASTPTLGQSVDPDELSDQEEDFERDKLKEGWPDEDDDYGYDPYGTVRIHDGDGDSCEEYGSMCIREDREIPSILPWLSQDGNVDAKGSKIPPNSRFNLPVFKQPSGWELNLLALEKGEWAEGMNDLAFKRWKAKERKNIPSTYIQHTKTKSEGGLREFAKRTT